MVFQVFFSLRDFGESIKGFGVSVYMGKKDIMMFFLVIVYNK